MLGSDKRRKHKEKEGKKWEGIKVSNQKNKENVGEFKKWKYNLVDFLSELSFGAFLWSLKPTLLSYRGAVHTREEGRVHLASRHDFEESLMEEEFLASTGHESMMCVWGGVFTWHLLSAFHGPIIFLIEV